MMKVYDIEVAVVGKDEVAFVKVGETKA